MPTVAPIRLVDTASLIDSPPSIATGAPPTTNFALAPAVSTGGLVMTDTLLFTGMDVVKPSLTDQEIVRLELVAVGEAKVTELSAVW